jgi:putative PEP-CTERM system TPR-repeat lipoprotein
VLAKDDKNLSAWIVLAEAQRMDGDISGAVASFSKAIEARPTDPRARLGRATVLMAQGKMDEASKDVAEVRKTTGDVPLALYLQAVLDFEKRNLDSAKDLLIKVEAAMPDYLPAKLLTGSVAYQRGEMETAENALSTFNRAVPGHIPAAKLLAATRLKEGRPADAIPVLKAVEANAKDDPQLLSLLGTAYMQTKELALGKTYLARAAALDPKAAAIRTQMAMGDMVSGDLEGAIKNLKSAVQLDENMHQADIMLVLALLRDKKFDEAIDAANKLKAKMKGDPMAENLLGAAYMAKGDEAKAREHWTAALEMKPEYASAGINLARLEIAHKNPEAATKNLESVLEHDPKNLDALIGLASVAEMQKDYPKMEAYLLQAREKNPMTLEPAMMLGRYYDATGKPLKALELARDISSKSPESPQVLQFLALTQIANNQLPNAILNLKKLVAKAPTNPEYKLQYILALRKSGEMNAAVSELNALVKAFPEYVPGRLAEAEVAMLDKNYAEVAKIVQMLQAKDPKLADGYRLEGDLLFAQKQLKKGVEAYQKAFEVGANSSSARRLFLARRAAGDDDTAFKEMSEWLKAHPEDGESWLAVAMAYQTAGKNKEALEAYEKCNALVPNNVIVLNNLAWLYQEMGDKRALEFAEKLQPKSENNPSVLDTVGWIYVQNGKVDKGLSLLQEAALQAPFQTDIRVHLAEAFIKAGQNDEARNELTRLLQEKKEFPARARAEELLKGL